ncbi:MAG: GatB/YqeY domain-containing protein [Patescibacteria group bacterium]|nr:GatB/YqeY domain-containing protein [Patescibacteria group bacterium]
MKGKNAGKVLVLRSLVAGLKNGQIEKKAKLTDDEENKIIKKEAKKRKDAILMYKKANRAELVKKEEAELEIIKAYLPKEMSLKEVEKIVKEMKENGKLGADFGSSMKSVMAKLGGKVGGKVVAEAVKKFL